MSVDRSLAMTARLNPHVARLGEDAKRPLEGTSIQEVPTTSFILSPAISSIVGLCERFAFFNIAHPSYVGTRSCHCSRKMSVVGVAYQLFSCVRYAGGTTGEAANSPCLASLAALFMSSFLLNHVRSQSLYFVICIHWFTNCSCVVEGMEDQLKLFEECQQTFPRAQMPRRLPLNFATGMCSFACLRRFLIAHHKILFRCSKIS